VGLPPFPVDDVTLAAVEHALGGSLTYEGDELVRVGADYSLWDLLDFMAGATGEDPDQEVLHRDWDGTPDLVVDHRQHYTPNDIIAALIAEVRRLRGVA